MKKKTGHKTLSTFNAADAADLRAIREKLGVSQERVARLLNVATVSVNRWENGHSMPHGPALDVYQAIAAAHENGVTPSQLAAAERGERGSFLLFLFTMAYGRKKS